jgi:hypothetical protein
MIYFAGMRINRILVLVFFLVLSNWCMAQAFQWDGLLVYLPEGWSSKNNRGAITYSNYNQQPQFLQSITLFPAQRFEGRPDTLFAHVWKQLVDPLQNPEAMPRWRRFYTEGGILMQQGSLETKDKDQPRFVQLNVFILESAYQACILQTTDAKTYRQIQNEWQERFLSVKNATAKKR